MTPAHIVILPIVLPLLAGAGLLLIDERRRALKGSLAAATVMVLLLVAMQLVRIADTAADITTYRLGNWDTPFGIVLVLDRLSALMVLLTAVLAVPALVCAMAPCHAAGSRVPSLLV